MSEIRTETKPWHDGIEGATLGVLQTRGWATMDATAAAKAMLQSLLEAEGRLSIPASEIVRFPKERTDPAMGEVYKRLGVPDDKAAYDFKDIKFADGTAPAEGFTALLQDTAHVAKLTPEQARAIVGAFVKHQDEGRQAAARDAATTAAAEDRALKASWGPNYDINVSIAQRAAAQLGVTPEAFGAALKQFGVGTATSMTVLHKLGVAMGEARFITGENPQSNGVLTPEQAAARLAEIRNSSHLRAKFAAGDPELAKEIHDLTELIVRARNR